MKSFSFQIAAAISGYSMGLSASGQGPSGTTNPAKSKKFLGGFWDKANKLSILLAIVVGIFILTQFGGLSFRMMQGTANEIVPEDIQVRFDDVKGCDEAKQELQDIVEFLMNPEKISALGGRLPKGVLLSGESVNFSVRPNGRNLGSAIFTERSAKLRQ